MTITTTSFGFVPSPAVLVADDLAGGEFSGLDCACDVGAMSIATQRIMNNIICVERGEMFASAAILKTLGITRAV